jgi:hypothetical protein
MEGQPRAEEWIDTGVTSAVVQVPGVQEGFGGGVPARERVAAPLLLLGCREGINEMLITQLLKS